MYHTEPPTDKTIREWYMNSSRVAACSFRSAQAATLLQFMYHSRIVLSVGGSVWYMIRNLRCTVTVDSVLANSKTQNAFLFTVNAIFLHDYPVDVEPGSTPRPLVQKKTWTDSLPIDMLLSVVSVLVVAQSSSEIPEGLMNNPVCVWDVELHYVTRLPQRRVRLHNFSYFTWFRALTSANSPHLRLHFASDSIYQLHFKIINYRTVYVCQ